MHVNSDNLNIKTSRLTQTIFKPTAESANGHAEQTKKQTQTFAFVLGIIYSIFKIIL